MGAAEYGSPLPPQRGTTYYCQYSVFLNECLVFDNWRKENETVCIEVVFRMCPKIQSERGVNPIPGHKTRRGSPRMRLAGEMLRRWAREQRLSVACSLG